MINDARIARFKQRISDTLATEELGLFYQLVEQYQQEHNVPAIEIAAALAQLAQGDTPLLLQNKPERKAEREWDRDERPARKERSSKDRPAKERGGKTRTDREREPFAKREPFNKKESPSEEGMDRFRIEVGHNHDVKPGNIVGAIANEADIDSKFIGRIDIHDDYSLVDLPAGMPKELLQMLKKVRVSGQQMNISLLSKDSKPAQKEKHPREMVTGKPNARKKVKVRTKSRTKDTGKKKARKKDAGK